jgi:hypothetical protein
MIFFLQDQHAYSWIFIALNYYLHDRKQPIDNPLSLLNATYIVERKHITILWWVLFQEHVVIAGFYVCVFIVVFGLARQKIKHTSHLTRSQQAAVPLLQRGEHAYLLHHRDGV